MKLWLKYLLAMFVGILLGVFLPTYGGDTLRIFEKLFTHTIHIGRYLVFPLLFFTIVIGSFDLWVNKRFFHVYGRMIAYSFISALVLAILGAVIIAIAFPGPVPIIIEGAEIEFPPSLSDQILMLFPKNFFQIFTDSGNFLLPIILFAVFFGVALLYHRSFSKPLVETFEGISKILHSMNRVVLEVLSLGIFFMAAYRIIQLKDMVDLELFSRLLLIILVTTIVVIFVFIPVLLYFLGNRRHSPYTWLFATLPVALSALLSGDNYFTVSSTVAVLNKNMGSDTKITSAMTALGAVFSRSGVAMITSISFILILRSYSSLGITFSEYLWVIMSSVLISFMLGTTPGNGILVSLAIISGWYARGLEESFLILLPAAPILFSLSVLLDTMVILFNCQLVMYWEKKARPAKPGDFL